KIIYTAMLKTSLYSTFAAKMNAFSYSEGWLRDYNRVGIYEVGTTLQGNEFFDYAEVGHDIYTDENLVQFEADLERNNWYNSYVRPVVYHSYPLLGKATVNRAIQPKGLPP